MKNGWSSRRPDMTYESCCGKISVVVYSSSTPASALITKSSGISSCFQVDVFVFYMFGSSSSSWDICVLPVSRPSRVCLINTSTSLSVNPLDIHLLYSHMDSLRNFIRRQKGKVPENVQNNLTQTSGLKTETVMLSQSPLFSHMDSVYSFSRLLSHI